MTEAELKIIYRQKRQKVNPANGRVIPGFMNTSFPMFLEWYDADIFALGCQYCGVTNERSYELYQMQRDGRRPDATRGGKRGRRLEIDRKNPFLPYDNLENLTWCSYWCNNAKSNFFTEEEFGPIAQTIGNALRAIR